MKKNSKFSFEEVNVDKATFFLPLAVAVQVNTSKILLFPYLFLTFSLLTLERMSD